MCLAPGVLQRHQATVLPLWQLRGEFERPLVRWGPRGGGECVAAGGQAFQSMFSLFPGTAWCLTVTDARRQCLSHISSEISRRPLHRISVTDTITHPAASPHVSFSFTPISHQPTESLSFSAAL